MPGRSPRQIMNDAIGTLRRMGHWAATSTVARQLAGAVGWLVEYGTAGYPDDTRRRLMILNVVAYLIAIATLGYALQHLFMDYEVWRPVIWINSAMVVAALMVPLLHRFGDIAGGLWIVVAEYVALYALTWQLGHGSGVHLQYIIASAAPFLVFGLDRMRLVLSVLAVGSVLHIAAWFSFPTPRIPAHQHDIDAIYISAAITTVGLISATVWYAFRLVERAKAETELLMRRILPDLIAKRLKADPGRIIADNFEEATVVFADISGFVELSGRLGADGVVRLFNELCREFDTLAERHGVEKIKTIGDCYMAVAGVPVRVENPAPRCAALALDMRIAMAEVAERTDHPIRMRIGMATGPLLAGVIGTAKLAYDVWGPTVNLAARLESNGSPGEIHVCAETRRRLGDAFPCEPLEPAELKGLGVVPRFRLAGPSTLVS